MVKVNFQDIEPCTHIKKQQEIEDRDFQLCEKQMAGFWFYNLARPFRLAGCCPSPQGRRYVRCETFIAQRVVSFAARRISSA